MTLKYPKKAPKRKEKLSSSSLSSPSATTDLTQYNESWTVNQPQQQQIHNNYHQMSHEYTPQYVEASQYSPEYYLYENNSSSRPLNKSPLLPQQLSPLPPPPPLTNHLMENCDWSAPTNHESAKPVGLTYTSSNQDENNNSHTTQWTTEFTYIDAKAEQQQQHQLCSPSNGGSLHQQTTELIPEFINFCEYDQQTGFPPSISSNASTLSSPTTSSDYNFNYQFDTLNSSMSNDGFEAIYQPQMIDTYATSSSSYEALPMETGVYSAQGGSYQSSEWTTTPTDISNIPYEPNYYPFANCTEKMMVY